MLSLSVVDWIVFSVYLFIVGLIGLFYAKRQRTTDDYFVGDRHMKGWVIGVSIFATSFSSVSFLALPREGAFEDYHFFVAILFIPLVITPLLWYYFVPFFVRMNVTSMYTYLKTRFDHRIQKAGALLFGLYAIGWMGTMLYAIGIILQAVLGFSDAVFTWFVIGIGLFATLYTLVGGFQAVVWTDVLQAVTLGTSMIIVLVLAVQHIDGGLSTVFSIGQANNKFDFYNLTLDLSERQSLITGVAYGLFMYLPGYTASQVMVQRYLSMENLAEARRSLAINAFINPIVAFVFFFTGTTLFAFYHQAGAAGFPDLQSPDQILPYFMSTELVVPGLTGLVVAGLFGAAMSSIDSGINSLAAVVVHDGFPDRKGDVRFSRLLSGGFGGVVTLAALFMPYLGAYIIEILTKVAGSFLGLLLALFLLGMLVPRATARSALIGLAVGACTLLLVWNQESIAHWWYGGIALVATGGIGYAASLLIPAVDGDAAGSR